MTAADMWFGQAEREEEAATDVLKGERWGDAGVRFLEREYGFVACVADQVMARAATMHREGARDFRKRTGSLRT